MVSRVRRWTFGRLDTASSNQLGAAERTAHAGTVRLALLLVVGAACGSAARHAEQPKPTTGRIAGLTRDHDTGDPIAKAEVRISAAGKHEPYVTASSELGLYDVDHLAPGTYSLTATFAGQPVDVSNIEVHAGAVTTVDIVFTLGRPEPIRVDYSDPKASQIDHYRPKNLTSTVSMIEGTVNDAGTHERVVGAVVTAVAGDVTKTQQTISDDRGHYRFDAVAPGVYSVSAYYSVSGRGQIEVRRSGIAVEGAEAVVVPLWIEMVR
jgi:hypothetical protein